MAGGGNSNKHGLMRLKNGRSQRASLGENVERLQRRVNEVTVGACDRRES